MAESAAIALLCIVRFEHGLKWVILASEHPPPESCAASSSSITRACTAQMKCVSGWDMVRRRRVHHLQARLDERAERMAPGCYLPHALVGIFPHPQGHDYWCYQSAIVRTALCYNTLVALPTGTGKTLVAAAVLHKFLQWCPTRLCIFADNRIRIRRLDARACDGAADARRRSA